ncbi:DUF7691 family protein [Streptomyces luteolifulvus]
MGHVPLAKAKPAADAYRAALDGMDENWRYAVQELIEKLEFEHERREYPRRTVTGTPRTWSSSRSPDNGRREVGPRAQWKPVPWASATTALVSKMIKRHGLAGRASSRQPWRTRWP